MLLLHFVIAELILEPSISDYSHCNAPNCQNNASFFRLLKRLSVKSGLPIQASTEEQMLAIPMLFTPAVEYAPFEG
ncbi:hypothetical protein Trydic_g12883 [Trypoxylus dichotomus]